MGAALDAGMANKLSVALIAAKNSVEKSESAASEQGNFPIPTEESANTLAPRFGTRSLPGNQLQQREAVITRRSSKGKPKMFQTQLPLAIVSKGRFDKSEPTIHKGEDLDIPTYLRRGVPLN